MTIMMVALLSAMNCLTAASGFAARVGVDEVEGDRADDGDRADRHERDNGDRGIGPAELCVRDCCGSRECERQVLGVRRGERRAETERPGR